MGEEGEGDPPSRYHRACPDVRGSREQRHQAGTHASGRLAWGRSVPCAACLVRGRREPRRELGCIALSWPYLTPSVLFQAPSSLLVASQPLLAPQPAGPSLRAWTRLQTSGTSAPASKVRCRADWGGTGWMGGCRVGGGHSARPALGGAVSVLLLLLPGSVPRHAFSVLKAQGTATLGVAACPRGRGLGTQLPLRCWVCRGVISTWGPQCHACLWPRTSQPPRVNLAPWDHVSGPWCLQTHVGI